MGAYVPKLYSRASYPAPTHRPHSESRPGGAQPGISTRLTVVVRRGFPQTECRVGVEDRLAKDRWISYSGVLRMRGQCDVWE
jgi:hypothetical protein